MTREEFSKPYLVAVYREHRRGDNGYQTPSELLKRYDLPRHAYFEGEVAEFMGSQGWGGYTNNEQGFTGFKIGPAGKIIAERLIEGGIDPAFKGEDNSSSGDQNTLTQLAAYTQTAIPASDRIVLISDNQVKLIEPQVDALLDALRGSNERPDDETFIPRIRGQIRAGWELIKSGMTRLYLLEQTLLTSLGELVARYKDGMIVNLATDLFKYLAVVIAAR